VGILIDFQILVCLMMLSSTVGYIALNGQYMMNEFERQWKGGSHTLIYDIPQELWGKNQSKRHWRWGGGHKTSRTG
jgi:hypothetical protein